MNRLKVDNMMCETCPTTVKKALSRLDGVFEVLVTFEPSIALVRFDAKRGASRRWQKSPGTQVTRLLST